MFNSIANMSCHDIGTLALHVIFMITESRTVNQINTRTISLHNTRTNTLHNFNAFTETKKKPATRASKKKVEEKGDDGDEKKQKKKEGKKETKKKEEGEVEEANEDDDETVLKLYFPCHNCLFNGVSPGMAHNCMIIYKKLRWGQGGM